MTDAWPAPPNDWFMVLEGPFFEDGSEEDPVLTGVPAAFLARLRAIIPLWLSLGLTDGATLGCYEDWRLRIGVEVDDPDANRLLGYLRIDVSDHDWLAGWVSPDRRIADPDMADADPYETTGARIVDEQAGVDEAVGWLESQLRRPILRHVWRDGGHIVAELWRVEDTGRELAAEGSVLLRSFMITIMIMMDGGRQRGAVANVRRQHGQGAAVPPSRQGVRVSWPQGLVLLCRPSTSGAARATWRHPTTRAGRANCTQLESEPHIQLRPPSPVERLCAE